MTALFKRGQYDGKREKEKTRIIRESACDRSCIVDFCGNADTGNL
jgi:hypothetical protein